jgi:hypothetical protein
VSESVEHPNATTSNTRFFKRALRGANLSRNPLTEGLTRLRAEGVQALWAIEECDLCGDLPERDMFVWPVDTRGNVVRRITSDVVDGILYVSEPSGVFVAVCDICETEMEYVEVLHSVNTEASWT